MADAAQLTQEPVHSPQVGELGSLPATSNGDPAAYYDRLRDVGPMVWDPVMGAWLITSYELVREVATRDDLVWRSPMSAQNPRPMGLDRDTWVTYSGSPWHLTLLEGEPHRKAHRWWMNAFSEKSLGRWKDALIEPVAHAQIDRFASAGRAELTSEYSGRVSPRVSAAVLGLPWDDEEWMGRLTALPAVALTIFEGQAGDSQNQAVVDRAMDAQMEILDMLMPFVRDRRDGKGEDLISFFWRDAADLMGPDFTERDIVAQVNLAFQGAADTTAHMTSNCLYLLLTQPELQARVRAGGVQATRALVEETLRLYGTIAWRPRTAMTDIELGGRTIRKGEQVVALTAGVQRDPDHYEDPADVHLDRAKPKDHFAFWRGPRQCPGRALARLELVSIVSVLLDRVEDLRLDAAAEAPQFVDWVQRHWTPLHATFNERPGRA